MISHEEQRQIEQGWYKIFSIWISFFIFLGFYIAVCYFFQDKLYPRADLPIEKLKFALFALSIITLIITFYLRKFLLYGKIDVPSALQKKQIQHPIVSKYITVIIITTALSESIGVYGFVLFLLTQQFTSLYSFIIISAVAMIYCRPKKEEVITLVQRMNKDKKGF